MSSSFEELVVICSFFTFFFLLIPKIERRVIEEGQREGVKGSVIELLSYLKIILSPVLTILSEKAFQEYNYFSYCRNHFCGLLAAPLAKLRPISVELSKDMVLIIKYL